MSEIKRPLIVGSLLCFDLVVKAFLFVGFSPYEETGLQIE